MASSSEVVSERQMGSIMASIATELLSTPWKFVVVEGSVTFIRIDSKAKLLTHCHSHGCNVVGTN